MRITNHTVAATILAGIQASGFRALTLQEQLATGRRINRPSDDPIGSSLAMAYRSRLTGIDQFTRNIGAALDRLAATENTVTQLSDIMNRAFTLAEKGASDGSSTEVRLNLATEVDQLLEEFVSLGNSKADGRYLFAGTADNQPAFTVTRNIAGQIDSVTASATADQSVVRLVGENETIEVNLGADETFGTGGTGQDLYQVLIDLRDRLAADDGNGVRALVPIIPSAVDQLTTELAVLGARTNRLTDLKERFGLDQAQSEAARSRIEDTDVTATIVELQEAQTQLQAALSTGARLLNISLLDYLK